MYTKSPIIFYTLLRTDIQPSLIICFLIECEFPRYGEKCAETCRCGTGALRCDPVRGCVCKPGFQGQNCEQDVNECLDTNVCGDVNKVCTNTIGSYECTCRTNYTMNNNSICEGKTSCLSTAFTICWFD